MNSLRVDWCSYEAAKFAVMNWHYSKRMPIGKIVKVGVWENGVFIGSVLYARGNTPTLGSSYGLPQTQVCELVRVALDNHLVSVSKIVSTATKMLKRQSEELRLIVSFADPSYSHNGTIYQAMNWFYTGKSNKAKQWLHDGRWKHNREMTSGAFGAPHKYNGYQKLPSREVEGKHRYLCPLDRAMRRQIMPLAQPYPKRAGEVSTVTSPLPAEGAGSTPAVRSNV